MRDSGLQAQRTALAWGRTRLAMIVNALLVLRFGVNAGDRPVEILGIGFFAISGGMLLIGENRRRQLAKTRARASPRVMAGCAVCVALVVRVWWRYCALKWTHGVSRGFSRGSMLHKCVYVSLACNSPSPL